MLGQDAHADESAGEAPKEGDAAEEADEKRGAEGAGAAEIAVEESVGEDLEALGDAGG